MKQASYSLIDFLKDPDFRDWVKHPDEAQDIYWQQFQELHPDKKPVLEQARQYVLVLAEQTAQDKPSMAESQLMRQTIQQRIHETTIPFTPSVAYNWSWTRIAASVVLVLGLGITAYWYSQNEKQPQGYQRFIQSAPQGTALSETRNNDTKPLTIFLSDGSSVVLQPGSRLSYPNTLTKREVYLTGKAFFEVVKDPANPFLVYTRGVATKVLGTSFSIDAPETNQPIKVAVKTGKVAVYSLDETTSLYPESTDSEQNSLVLTPNQSAEYVADSHHLVRKTDTVSTFLQPGTLIVAKQSFDFDETPVSDVFRTLEKAYGIDIVYNESALGKCSLTASLVGQPFHEKLSAVCKALDAHYSIQGNQVVITGGQRCQ
ncbi:FecR family protein [Spirosoma validum]|uniref:FecR family protein n=1 Tax=Spirosoma validum TaxID=2771355 RepID=A0A927GGS6_9BACT|nr:FecR family protein [Spirosoma validum]MBD2757194.1 FecR family protein [Spirosoma validum]